LLLGAPAILTAQSVRITEYQPTDAAGIVTGPDGALWFTEYANIGRITTSGTIMRYPIPAGGGADQIAVGSDNALWFTEFGSNRIGRITTSGMLHEYPIPTSSIFGTSGPSGITVGPDGAMWFSEYYGHNIGRITTAGVLTEFPIQYGYPAGIVVGPDGALWFTEFNFSEIGRITTSGVVTHYPVPSPVSNGIATGPDGALWFTENNPEGTVNNIGRLTTSGAVTEYPLPGGSDYIAAGPDGALWFTDNGGNRIGRISTSGTITEYLVPTSNSGPSAITTGPDGALWFVEGAGRIGQAVVVPPVTGNVTVTASPAGLTVTVDGASYTGSVSFNWAAGQSHSIGVATAVQGGGAGTRYAFTGWSDGGGQTHNVTVPSSAITYTAAFTPQYQLSTSVAPPGGGSISVSPTSPDGFYNSGSQVQFTATANPGFGFSNWSSDLSGSANPQSLTMSAPRTVQANFTGLTQTFSFSEYPTPTSASGPYSIMAGPDGALWFTEPGVNKIGRITTAGVITEYATGSTPQRIATGPDGALWFTESLANKIGRITTSGAITEYPVPTLGTAPNSITTGPDGALWFTESAKIGRIDAAGMVKEYPIPSGVQPSGIATGPDGALWFTETFDNRIGRITTSGAVTEYSIPTSGSGTYEIAAGPDGALWFAENFTSKIGRITTSGTITEYPVAAGTLIPAGIVAGPDGALWFVEEGTNNSIGRITTAGVATAYAIPGNPMHPELIAAGPDGALWFTADDNEIWRLVPPGVTCTYSVPPGGQVFPAGGGGGTAVVRAPAGGQGGCPWTASSGVPWVTITSGSSGKGNGTVGFTVVANPFGAARSGTLTIANQTYTVTQAESAAALSCAGNVPSVPQAAIEGRTELLGDYVLSCSGLSGALAADITLTLNTNVTNKLGGSTTDAVLTVNGSGAGNGVVAGFNSLRWPGVSLVPAGNSTASLRISGVRADASPLLTERITANPGTPQPTAITGQVSVSGVPVSNAVEVMANAVQAMVFTEQAANPAMGGPQTLIPMVFQEAQASSFSAAVTRLYLSLSNVPATVQVYAPVFPNEGARAQLYSADVNGFGGSPVAGSPFAGGVYQPLIASGGTVTATWVVLAADPATIETFTFPLVVVNAGSGDLSQMQVAASLAPWSDLGIPSATAPVPRYRNFSVQPRLANLRVGTSVAVAGTAGTVKGNARTQAGMPVPLVGSNLTFLTQVVNDTSDPNLIATNVVVRDNLPTGLNLISCMTAAGVNCGGTGANIGTLTPGQGTAVTVVAAVDPSYTGATVENPVSASSDEVNLDLLASTSSSGFLLGGVPVTVAANPAAGSGPSQNFTFQFSDAAGYQMLGVVNVLINSVLDGRNACYLAYSVPLQTLYLVDDSGDAGGSYSGSLVLGSSSTIHNSQCAVSLVSVLGSETTLTLTLNIAFQAGFGGNKVAFVAARDQGTGNTDWQALGVWQVPAAPAGAIAVTGVMPTRGAGPSGTGGQFQFTLTDSKGTGDFGIVNVLVNKFIDGRQACYLAFVASNETLVLVDDSGDAGGPWAGSMVLNGGSGAISNSQCSVSGTGSAVAYSPGTMTLTLNITFQGGFGGNRVFYVAGRDQAGGNNTGWQAVGTWTVQ